MARRSERGTPKPLDDYRAKRTFSLTSEPAGAAQSPATPARAKSRAPGRTGRARKPAAAEPRFVIHEHDARNLHWDLRLERDGVLVSWAIPKGLPPAPGQNHFAAHTEDHPLEYATFEGHIPRGQYGAGRMDIWDSGTYECLKWDARKVEVALHGQRIDARYALFAIGGDDAPGDWMIHRMDPPADPAIEPMPERIQPMLARAGSLPKDDQRWAFEIKWDGVRAIAHSTPGSLSIAGRRLNDITASYPELSRLRRALRSHSAILDGEIVAFDEQHTPSFAALQRRMHVSSPAQAKRLAKTSPVTYMIFDLIWLDGHPLISLPYAERRAQLEALELSGEHWQTPDAFPGPGSTVLAASAAHRLEGVVAKRLDSTYEPGRRSSGWVKVKNHQRQEFVIGGWVPEQGRRKGPLGALLVGVYDEGALLYAGRVGTGFTHAEAQRLASQLEGIERPASPFVQAPSGHRAPRGAAIPRGARFAEPQLVAEVEFTEWTAAGSLRHPSYKGLRDDKLAAHVLREDRSARGSGGADPTSEPVDLGPDPARPPTDPGPDPARPPMDPPSDPARRPVGADPDRARRPVDPDPAGRGGLSIEETRATKAHALLEGRELSLSNLSKVLYPRASFSKRHVIDYYAAIAPALLPHLHDRALTVTRWPDGVEEHSFFQKHAPAHRPDWVQTATIASRSKPIDYILAQDLPTLIWLANLAALELHTPLARFPAIERPTALVFDLDPGPPADVINCCHVALALHGMFGNLGLQCLPKTSGLKGLQLYLPLNSPRVTYEQTKTFARTVAQLLEHAEPDLVVSRMSRARREGRVLIDWSQNDARKTTVCAYSLRAAPRPTVSTPLEWDEITHALDSRDPTALAFEAADVIARVNDRGDLFAPVLSLVQKLPAL